MLEFFTTRRSFLFRKKYRNETGKEANFEMKNKCMSITAGIAAGVVIGAAAGWAVKSMLMPKSPIRKSISTALETAGEVLNSLSKITN